MVYILVMQKEDWIRLAMPAAISLLAVSIITLPFAALAAQRMKIEGSTQGHPIKVKIVK